ncbi:uncharacterized protein LOC100206447 isoform X2 [Hydra vulgaris]|uniref:Uncharacterized protein LOC100206447 isoform X2 n=1 Tax=Hydra vulgaris TaxID=6087 RepID=A0ABM4C8R1_HYDVU
MDMTLIAFALAFNHWITAIRSDCDFPLGMENGLIHDDQITASHWLYFETSKNTHYAPYLGRLNYNKSSGGWCSADSETYKDQYIQIDLLKNKRISAIATQGKSKSNEYVEKYQIYYLRDDGGTDYREYNESGVWKMFDGNLDSVNIVKNYFMQPIIARKIRLYPRGDEFAIHCLRLELYGCDWKHDASGLKSYVSQNGGIHEGSDLTDFSYDGWTENGTLFGGLGKLTDDIYRNSELKDNKSAWVGYNSFRPEITFQFIKKKLISKVMIYIKNQNDDVKIFRHVDIEFSNNGQMYNFAKRYTPSSDLVTKRDSFAVVINIEAEARFIKLLFTKSSKWLLISEIAFISGSYSIHPSLKPSVKNEIDFEKENEILGYKGIPFEKKSTKDTEDSIALSFPTIITITVVGMICAVTQIRGVGGATPRETVKNVLSAIMECQHYFARLEEKDKFDTIVGDKIGHNASSIEGMKLFTFTIAFNHWITAIRSDCDEPLGMENGLILDDQITASHWLYFETSKNTHYAPYLGRLNYNKSSGGWCSADSETYKDQYIQIDLLKNKRISAVATQGKSKSNEYVEKYQIYYLRDDEETSYRKYNESGVWKMFDGNLDSVNIVKNYFTRPIIARTIRLYPRGDEFAIHCLRLELYGCDWMHYASSLKSYTTKSSEIREGNNLTDISYDGWTKNGTLFGGLGMLTDDIYRDSELKNNYLPWVGFNSIRPEIVFQLTKKKFISKVIIYIKNQDENIKIFKHVDIESSKNGERYSLVKRYTPASDLVAKRFSFAIVINFEAEARFIKFIFTKYSTWLLISEILFIPGSHTSFSSSSPSVVKNKPDLKKENERISSIPFEKKFINVEEDSFSLSFSTVITTIVVGVICAVILAVCAFKLYTIKKKNEAIALQNRKTTFLL